MKIYSICTPSHAVLRDEWFLPSICDDFPVQVVEADQIGDGTIGNEAFNRVTLLKVRLILSAIEEQWGKWFIFSDVDVQFLQPVGGLAEACLKTTDICFQQDSPTGELCTGFFAARANDAVRRLWMEVERSLAADLSEHEQTWLNRVLDPVRFLDHPQCPFLTRWLWTSLRGTRLTLKTYRFCALERWARLRLQSLSGVRVGLFPTTVFGAGTMTAMAWDPTNPFQIPENACVHHANFAAGTKAKIEQFEWVARHRRNTP